MEIRCGKGIRKESLLAQIIANDIRSQLQTAKAENTTNQIPTSQLMNFTNGGRKNLHDRGGVGDKKNKSPIADITGRGKVMSEKTTGKFATKAQNIRTIESKIEKGVDSRNLRPMEKTRAGNPTINLGAIPVKYKDSGSGIINVWEAQNFSEMSHREGCAKYAVLPRV